jgi:hypothetical protein
MGRKESVVLNGLAGVYKARQLADSCRAPCDDEFAQRYPSLLSILVNNLVDDDHAVDNARLSISVSGGDWEIGLGCSALNAFGTIHAKTFLGGLEALESQLSSLTFAWVFNRKKQPKLREVKKKKEKT